MSLPFRPLLAAFFVALLALSGCGKEGVRQSAQGATFRWSVYPVSLQLESSLYNDASAQADLREAIAFWENAAGKSLFVIGGEYPAGKVPFTGTAANPDTILDNVIFFQNPWPFANDVAAQTILHAEQNITQHGLMMLNSNTVTCTGDCLGQPNATSQRKLFAHELGHFIGFDHSTDVNDVMYPTIQTGGSLDFVEINSGRLQQLVN